jgi:predicted metal-binding protein
MPGDAEAERVTVFVCVSCRRVRDDTGVVDEPGAAFASGLKQRLEAAGAGDITVAPIDCLAVCNRPCTVAIAADGCWTYVLGDLDPQEHCGQIADAVIAYKRSGNGIVPWEERPAAFRKGVVARIPPLGFIQPSEEAV